jgi:hypothetical protein
MDDKVQELYDEVREYAMKHPKEFESAADFCRSRVEACAWDLSSYAERYVTKADSRALEDPPEARKHLRAAHEQGRDIYVSLAVLSGLQGYNALKDSYMNIARHLQTVLEHKEP